MFLQRITRPRLRKNGTESQRSEVRYLFRCDHCDKEYEKKPGNVSASKSGLHFCSNECKFASRSTGKLKIAAEETSLKNNGTRSPMQSEKVKAKHRQGFQQTYGSDVTSPLHVPGAKEKRRRTHLERYGFEETFQAEGPKAKRRATWFQNYGVPYRPFDQIDLQRIMQEQPHKWSSKVEEEMCKLLAEQFGEVIRQKRVHKWPIDAYVPAIDTYIQLDGVYWHGLDRPIEIIQASSRPRDQAIYQKWLNDREQDAWFAEKGLRLVRITDVQLKLEGIKSLF